MALVQTGSVRAECDDAATTLVAGGLLLAPPGSRPRLRADGGAAVNAVSFSRSLVDAFASESSVDCAVEILASGTTRVTRLSPCDLDDAVAAFAYIEREVAAPRSGYEPILKLKIMELVILLSRGELAGTVAIEREALSGPPSVSGRFRAQDLKRYIDDRYADQLSLNDLANRFGLSPAYLSNVFSKETGYTIVEYLNSVRIRKSCVLLKRSDASILDIALAVGYNSLSHFNSYFRRLVGSAPREYRNRSRM